MHTHSLTHPPPYTQPRLLIEDPFQRILRTSWTGVIADTVMRDVQWNIAENRGSSSGQASREPPYSSGPAPGSPLDAMPAGGEGMRV